MGTPIVVAIAVAVAIAVSLSMFLSSPAWKAAEEKARERRMAEHRMNARLLRFNL